MRLSLVVSCSLVLLAACSGSSAPAPVSVASSPVAPPPAAPPPAAPAPAAPPPPAPVEPQADTFVSDADRQCKSNADCTLTTEDCCGCEALGKQIGVRRDRLQALADRRRPVCSAIGCAQAMSDDPTCMARSARCADGLCVPDLKQQP